MLAGTESLFYGIIVTKDRQFWLTFIQALKNIFPNMSGREAVTGNCSPQVRPPLSTFNSTKSSAQY